MKSPIRAFHGIVVQGKPKLKMPEEFKLHLSTLEGQEIVVSVEKRQTFRKRSNNQNRFYWAYLNIISQEIGEQPEELHEYFKRKFLKPRTVNMFGEEIRLPGTTKNLDSLAFTEYIDKIASITGVPVPNPEDVYDY